MASDTTLPTVSRHDPRMVIAREVVVLALFGWWANWPMLGLLVALYLPIRWLLIAIHEYGHVIGASIGGLKVLIVSIGTGPSTVMKSDGVETRLGLWPTAGHVAALPTRYSGYRDSRIMHVAGGPAASLAVLAVLLIWRPGAIGWVAIIAQVVVLGGSLPPFETVRLPGLDEGGVSDGLQLARLLFIADEGQVERERHLVMLDPPRFEVEEDLAAAKALLDDPGLDPLFLVGVKGTAAYYIAVLGVADRYDEADRLSWEAVSADPSDANMDTRGCVLAMMGRGQEAVPLLERGLVGIEALGLGDEERGWCHSFMAKAYLDSGAESEARSHAHIAAGFGVSIPALQEVQERLGLSQGD
jgi:hypothetical protein